MMIHIAHIRRLMLLALLVLIVSCGSLNAAQDSQIQKKVLDNGLTVVVKTEPGSGLVAVVAMVRAGSAQETNQTAGIGIFVAQLLLASTRQSSAEDVASIADQVGGNIAAEWHPDFTEIRMVTTTAGFSKAIRLIGECLTEANFEDKWVSDVRRELMKNLNADGDDIFQNAYNQLRELLYSDNGYKRPDLGFERTITLAKPQDLQKFHSAYYVPNNITISIVGDISPKDAFDRADGTFAGAVQGVLPVQRPIPDETLDRSKFIASEQDLSTAYLLMGWLAPGVRSPDYAAMAVAANALGGGKGSMMFRELRQKRGMGYDVGVMYPRFKNQSHIVAYVITDPFKMSFPSFTPTMVLDEVKTALLEQINLLKAKPLSEKDLKRAKGYTIGSYALTHQHIMDRAFQLAWLETTGLGYETYKSFPDAVDKVTADEVQRIANKYFGNYAAVLLLPKAKNGQAGE